MLTDTNQWYVVCQKLTAVSLRFMRKRKRLVSIITS